MKALYVGFCLFFAVSVNAEIRTFNFTGEAGSETVQGYFGLDTSAVAFSEDGFIGASYGLFDSDVPLVNFGATFTIGSTELTFNSQRPVVVGDDLSTSFGVVFNDQLAGVDGLGNAVFSDSLKFTLLDQGIAATPPNPLLSTTQIGDIVNYLFFAEITVLGSADLISGTGNGVPSTIDFTEATFAQLRIQIGSAIFDPALDRFVSLGDSSGTYDLTGVSVAPVPLPAPILLLGWALAGLGWFRRKTS